MNPKLSGIALKPSYASSISRPNPSLRMYTNHWGSGGTRGMLVGRSHRQGFPAHMKYPMKLDGMATQEGRVVCDGSNHLQVGSARWGLFFN